MPHFFISSNSVNDSEIIISDSENYRHIAKSLRVKKGEQLLLIDENKTQYETVVDEISKNSINVSIIKSYKSDRILDFDLYLAQSPLHTDAQNFLLEKATELGVKSVIPIYTDNCSMSKHIISKKIDKWNKIMYESSKQCERADIPNCQNLTYLDKIDMLQFDRVIVFCERIATKTLKDIEPIKKQEKVLVIVGCEGGFSKREFEYFAEHNFEMLTLGNLILRAETAATVALGNIIYEFYSKN